MLLALRFCDLDEVFHAETGGLLQNWTGDDNRIVSCQPANDGRRCLRNGSKLCAHFSESYPSAEVRDRPDLDRLYETVQAEKGHIDILYASAGVGEFNVPLGSITEAGFDKTFNVNVRGTLFTVQKALPLMPDGGSIIMTGSIASVKGFEGLSVYSATKAAVRSFARSWTVDLKARKIRVNVISPGTIDTGVFVGVPKEVKDQFVAVIPMGRIGQPHEIAAAALFLASDASSYMTGSELVADGGMSA